MELGLKRGVVKLADHNPEWKEFAVRTIEQLWRIFGSVATDIQHVGSTAIRGIKAKPIIDIAVAVEDFAEVELLMPQLNEAGFFKSKLHAIENDMLICDDNEIADTRSYHVHIVKVNSVQWNNYLNFRDYLNSMPDVAKEYERLKVNLATKHPSDRNAYTDGKDGIVAHLLSEAQTWAMLHDIPGFNSFTQVNPVTKGMSGDKKYYVETIGQKRLLLRVADIAEYDLKKMEYEVMQRAVSAGVPMSQTVDFGICNSGKSVYTLLTWIDGENAEITLTKMSEAEQYNLGIKAGELLQIIHAIPAPKNAESWEGWFFCKVQDRINFYNTSPIKYENGNIIVHYLQDKRHLLNGRQQTFTHNDYTMSNLIVTPDGSINVIDFICFNNGYGDPWWDFHPVLWDGEKNAHFFTGLVKGYFNGEPPCEFFDVLLYYFAYDVMTGIQIDPMNDKRHINNIMSWLDNMKNPVPTWYSKGELL
ncbi:MAG: GrpB family protein [Oscillospiraceae bacterium]|nr:GrpB family protein [Oscillospiraceae bacterium]MDD4414939.1 GrpB family protein [Oscillospiraceae bacterium]